MAVLDHQFSQFEPSDLEFSDPNLFPDADFPLPPGFLSDLDLDLDLDDISVDFSLDDYLISDSFPNPNPDPHPPSPESGNTSSSSSDVINHDEEVKAAEQSNKRKSDGEECNHDPTPSPILSPNPNPNPNPRSVKSRRSDEPNSPSSFSTGVPDGDEKKKARLIRNRESAQLSRQRRKHYVEELEGKVRSLNSTVTELNSKISFYVAENARLHQQLTGNNGRNPPPPSAALYPPPPPMHFPWIPYPGYPMHQSSGSHVPPIPIPRLKPQQPASAPKEKIKKSREGKSKTKKVASVSLLGVFFVFLVFGGVLNFGLGSGAGSAGPASGRILNVSGRTKGLNHTETGRNSSETIQALLYVPRNGKHVEINGNLIIHSVLASDRSVAEKKAGEEAKLSLGKESTDLAIPANVVSALAVPTCERELGRHQKGYENMAKHHRSLASDSMDMLVDGPLQQWFREGLAGPILSSGTCTEVFQFEVSQASTTSNGIIPATTVINATDKQLPPGNMKNRRILYPHPMRLAESTLNDTGHVGKSSEDSRTFHSNSTLPSMVVSVMADPREAGDGDGMITPKSLSRIFVVVLVDSVKYVTYSCMLPLKSHSPHLVN